MNYHNIDIEKTIIGTILLEPISLHKILDILKDYHFYSETYSKMYKFCIEMVQDGNKIDYLTLYESCKKNNLKIEIYEIAQLTTRIASATQIEIHSRIIVENYLKREMHKTGQLIQTKLIEGTDISDVKDFMYKKIIEYSEIGHRQNTIHISQSIQEIEQQQQSYFENEKEVFHTNLKNVDDNLRIERSDLIIIAARPAMGKTAFSLNILKNYAKSGKKAAMFSLEMSHIQLSKRIVASESMINSKEFDDLFSDSTSVKFYNSKENLSKLGIFIDDTSNLTILDLRTRLTELVIKHEIDIAIVDYLQLMTGNNKGNREQDISEISRGMKILAKELNIPIIALSQLNRGLESRVDKRPKLSDLRESGSIEQDADVVLFLYRPEVYGITKEDDGTDIAAGYTELICSKYRNGGLFTSDLLFQKEYQKFYDYNPHIPIADEDPFTNPNF